MATRNSNTILNDLAALQINIEQAERARDALIIEARTENIAWASIGAALGVSSQTAWNRHHHLRQEQLIATKKMRGR